jgi:phosphatidate cytidylyltransferase
LLFGLIGLVCSIVNIFGDLFESLLKRRVDIKDFGKIMPGHGGVLDRIDGTLFVVVIICVVFALV